LGKLCGLFGVTRQAYYEANAYEKKTSVAHMIVLRLVSDLREVMPMVGTRKILYKIEPMLKAHGIKMGRDQLFDLLRFHGLLIRRRRRGCIVTTNSYHWLKKYPNLIEHIAIYASEQVWVADITYVKTAEGYSYLSLITDAYSRMILGYSLHPTLESAGCIEALRMALSNRIYPKRALIHHSDRGVQYCSENYVDILLAYNISISMTQNSSPYENALAERMNGIIKSEFLLGGNFQNHNEARKAVERIVATYNKLRPHSSLNYLTPDTAHAKTGVIQKKWKKYQKFKPKQLIEM
jgi:putative transposase